MKLWPKIWLVSTGLLGVIFVVLGISAHMNTTLPIVFWAITIAFILGLIGQIIFYLPLRKRS